VVRVIKARRGGEHVALWGTGEVHARFWCVNLKEIGHWEDLGLDEMIILNSIFNKQGGKAWNRFIWHLIRGLL
jgi:hypothetical protein